jgi:hypothetical protein
MGVVAVRRREGCGVYRRQQKATTRPFKLRKLFHTLILDCCLEYNILKSPVAGM